MFGKKVRTTATILADEGYKYVSNGPTSSKQHEKYIVEVHPEGEAPFRVEVKAWVSWPDMPRAGDTVNVWWKPGTEKIEIDLDGDPRFDAKLRRDRQQQEDAARREALLHPERVAAQPQVAPAPQAQDPSVCPSCGQPRAAGAAFCPRCGHHLT